MYFLKDLLRISIERRNPLKNVIRRRNLNPDRAWRKLEGLKSVAGDVSIHRLGTGMRNDFQTNTRK